MTASDPSVVLDETISRFADSWKAAREVNRDLQRTVSTVEDGCRRLQEKIALRNQALAELAPSCEGFLTVEHRNRLAEWKDHSSTAAHLRDRLSDKNAAQERLAQENERIRESSCALDSERGRELSWAVVYLLAALSACVGFGMLVLATSDAGMNPGGFLLAGLVLVATGPLFIEWNSHEERRTQALVQTRKESLA